MNLHSNISNFKSGFLSYEYKETAKKYFPSIISYTDLKYGMKSLN